MDIFHLKLNYAWPLSVDWNRKTRWYVEEMVTLWKILCKNTQSNYPLAISKPPVLHCFGKFFSYNFIFYLTLAKFMHSKLVIQEKIAYHIWQQSQCRRAWSQHIDKILEKSIDKPAWQTACAKIIWVTTVRLRMICALIITVFVPDKQIQQ